MKEQKFMPVHPGKILLQEFLKPMGISQNKLSVVINVPPRRINEIVNGKRRISPDTALRLGLYFGTSPQFWLGLQTDYDLGITANRLGDRLKRDIREYATCV
jgi:addiction module HigA family antidote